MRVNRYAGCTSSFSSRSSPPRRGRKERRAYSRLEEYSAIAAHIRLHAMSPCVYLQRRVAVGRVMKQPYVMHPKVQSTTWTFRELELWVVQSRHAECHSSFPEHTLSQLPPVHLHHPLPVPVHGRLHILLLCPISRSLPNPRPSSSALAAILPTLHPDCPILRNTVMTLSTPCLLLIQARLLMLGPEKLF